MTDLDVIVAGVGAMGAQACWHLARRGQRVLGLDRYDISNSMGSSHGISRIIRLAYFEDPVYVPILRRSYSLWRETEQLAGEQLLFITGSIDIGSDGSDVIRGSLESCRLHHLPHETLSAAEIHKRFPGYLLPAGFVGVYQQDGGFVASERAITAAAKLAMDAGAVLKGREPVLSYSVLPHDQGVEVRTDRNVYRARRLVLTTGAWIGELARSLKAIAIPERQTLGWFRPKRPEQFQLGVFPVSNLKSEVGHFYQFPIWGALGFKIGLYHHLREQGPADRLSREPNADDEQALRRGLRSFFPEADGDVLAMKTCLFTNTPDEHFIIDRLPDAPMIIVASPCSGHGFKFSSAIGEILADLAMDRAPQFDLTLFKLSRFS